MKKQNIRDIHVIAILKNHAIDDLTYFNDKGMRTDKMCHELISSL